MIPVFKQIYNTIILRKMMNVIMQRDVDNADKCLFSKRQMFNLVYFHSDTLKWQSRWILVIFQNNNSSFYKHFYVLCIPLLEITWLIVVIKNESHLPFYLFQWNRLHYGDKTAERL